MNEIQYSLPIEPTANWVKSSLAVGPSLSLAKLVSEKFLERNFSFTTIAAADLAQAQLTKFHAGGKIRSTAADEWLMRGLASFLDSGCIIVVEDWRATPSSPFLTAKKMPAVFFGEEVYYVLKEDPRKYDSWRLIFSNTVPAFHAFVVPGDMHFEVGNQFTIDCLAKMAENIRAVVCGAYDGESYIFCGLPRPK